MRSRSSLLGWLGGVLILFALLSFLLQLFSGLPLMVSELGWSLGNLVAGLVLLAIALGTNVEAFRERMRSGEARRAGKYGTSAILSTVLGIALLTMGAYAANRYHMRFDWTEAKTHSLSDQSRKVLKDLKQDVHMTALYAAVSADEVRDLLSRYTYASSKVKVSYVDPQAQPGRVRALGVDPAKLKGGLVHIAIGKESVDVDKPTEASITNAIVKLERHEQKKVYFLVGHGEHPISGKDGTAKDGYADAAKALENENYLVEPLMLATKGDVPADANVVVEAGPTRPLLDTELAALQRYMAKGGAMLVLLDPQANTNVTDDLKKWGVAVGDDMVIDRVQGLFGRPTMPFAAEYANQPITRDLGEAVLFFTARSVEPAPAAQGAIQWLVRTSKNSWGERDLKMLASEGKVSEDATDLKGPVPVAVAGTIQLDPSSKGKRARLVVVGDSDFASNQLLGQFANKDFFVNSVNWLLGDVQAISIRPHEATASRLQLSTAEYLQIRYLSLFVLPEAIAILGVFVWWSRRRAPGR
jgi:ABC-type uncharacterized transport system involved in gliding motility auxiliary subunit